LRKPLDAQLAHAAVLAGKSVHIVDDDIRNVFALTSVLEKYHMNVSHSEDSRRAVSYLKKNPETEIVLMDIMMPGKDGYETMREIREMDGFLDLPMIALTAKAMKGDREKCLEAGASDYIAKPVDIDRLLSLLRTWLFQ
jgi:CheY-like chemotaxis protein